MANIAAIEYPLRAETRRHFSVFVPTRDRQAVHQSKKSRRHDPAIFPEESPEKENPELSNLHRIGDVGIDSGGYKSRRSVVRHRRSATGGMELLHRGDKENAGQDQKLQIEFVGGGRTPSPGVPIPSQELCNQKRPNSQQQRAVKTKVHHVSSGKMTALARPTGEELRRHQADADGKSLRKQKLWARVVGNSIQRNHQVKQNAQNRQTN